MPHSTFFSTPPPPIPEAKPLPPVANTTTTTSLTGSSQPSDDFLASLKASPLRSPIKPTFTLPPARNRFFVMTHGHARSKSESATMTLAPTSVPASFAPPSPNTSPRLRTREYPPPLLRTSSLPLVIPEGRKHRMTSATPTTPPAIPRSPFLGGVPRSASPTRIYASSISPAGIRSGYYPGSSFSPRTPSPPAYLVNEGYPSSSSSSSPSTPNSLRSRSPSISSLETIPDTPDAEQEALELEIKEAMERKASRLENEEEDDSGASRRRRSVDFDRTIRWGAADKRKRWSVCGGEKRSDLDLETIWEEVLCTAEANHIIHRAEEDEEDEESVGSDEHEDSTDQSDDLHQDSTEEEGHLQDSAEDDNILLEEEEEED